MALLRFNKDACFKLIADVKNAEIPFIASSLAFSTLVSVVPFFALALLAMKGISGMEFLGDKFQSLIVRFFQGTAGAEVGPQVERLLRRITSRELGITSAAVLFFTSLQLFLRVEYAVNLIWEDNKERAWWLRALMALGFYLLVPLGLAIYGGFRFGALREIFNWSPVLWDGLVTFTALLLVNRWMPSTKVPWKSAFTGALVSTVLMLILQVGMSWATKEVFDHSKLYGSLAAIPLFCVWIVMGWRIILLGVSVAASLTRQSKNPTLSPSSRSRSSAG